MIFLASMTQIQYNHGVLINYDFLLALEKQLMANEPLDLLLDRLEEKLRGLSHQSLK